MLLQRVVSAIVGIPVVLAFVWIGGWPFFLLMTGISHLALVEYYKIAGVKERTFQWSGYAANILLLAVVSFYGLEHYLYVLAATFIALNMVFIIKFPVDFNRLTLVLWGKVYITTMLGLIILIRSEGGFLSVLVLLLAVWVTDTGAYFAGTYFGRHKLIPSVSPKKTVEGAAAGLLAAGLAVALAMSATFGNLYYGFGAGLIISLAAQLGDLAESALKRWGKTKDSGSIIPGHGGILDRVDSLLFAALPAYILLAVL